MSSPLSPDVLPPSEPALPPKFPFYLLPLSAVLSVLTIFLPRTIGRVLRRVPLWHSAVIAILNFVAMLPLINLLSKIRDMDAVLYYPRTAFITLFLGFFLGLFFIILPFIPRPGTNRSCVYHVVRAVFLSTTWIYVWIAVFYLLNRYFSRQRLPLLVFPDTEILAVGIGAILLFWMLWNTIRSTSHEYRAPRDMPPPRHPRCDRCGYDLRGSDINARCPECGLPVADSLTQARQPSPWENDPRPIHPIIIWKQVFTLIQKPQSLFRSIPLLTGHRAAHRWLAFNTLFIAFASFWIAGGLHLAFRLLPRFTHNIVHLDDQLTFRHWQFYAAGLAISAVWTYLGIMMVGIETAGIATFSYLRRRPTDLAAASKVTSYASTLLLFWVFLGGLQACALAIYANTSLPTTLPPRWDALLTTGPLALAHIGGLLWFEFVVYRGMAAIQYANK